MRLTVDTNVLARVLTNDGTEQSALASACFRINKIFITDTVLVETEWVLRSRIKLDRATIVELFSALLSWPNVSFQSREKIIATADAPRVGLDFADAIHLFGSADCEAMITFDAKFIRRSKKIAGAITVRRPTDPFRDVDES